MDEVKIKLDSELTRGLIGRIVTKILKKKFGVDSLTVMIKQLDGGLREDEMVVRADVVLYASKQEVFEKLKGEL